MIKILYDDGDIRILYFECENRIYIEKDSTGWDYWLNYPDMAKECVRHLLNYSGRIKKDKIYWNDIQFHE